MRNRAGNGFTLLELLVVVAVIALLVALVVPAMGRARALAVTTQCASNMRQLAAGWHIYSQEFEDVMLPGRVANLRDSSGTGGEANPANHYQVQGGLKYRPRWAATLATYAGVAPFAEPLTEDRDLDASGGIDQFTNDDADRQLYSSDLLICPAAAQARSERNAAYGYNYQFLGNARTWPGSGVQGGVPPTPQQFRNFPVRVGTIRDFARTVMAADSLGRAAAHPEADRTPWAADASDGNTTSRQEHGWSLDPPRLTARSDIGDGGLGTPIRIGVDDRHAGNVVASFIDGHVEQRTLRELGYRQDDKGVQLTGLDALELFGGVNDASDPPTNALFSGNARDADPPELPTDFPES